MKSDETSHIAEGTENSSGFITPKRSANARGNIFDKKEEVEKPKRANMWEIFINVCGPYVPSIPFPDTKFLDPLREIVGDRFECFQRGSTVNREIYCGFVNFFSCLYCLPVLSYYMQTAGYNQKHSFTIMALMCGFGTIASGFITNTPLVIAPPTSELILLVSSLNNHKLSPEHGNYAVVCVGASLALIGLIAPVGPLLVKLIPRSIQIGTTIGIGLFTALAGAEEINLVERGQSKLLKMGPVTDEIVVVFFGIFMAIMLKMSGFGAIILAPLFGCTFIWWCHTEWPSVWCESPELNFKELPGQNDQADILGKADVIALLFIRS